MEKVRSSRAAEAEITAIVAPPTLAIRTPLVKGLELWQIELVIQYFRFAVPQVIEEARVLVRLVLGRCRPAESKPEGKAEAMIVVPHIMSDELNDGVIRWALDEWNRLYADPPSQPPVIRDWVSEPALEILDRITDWADPDVAKFWDRRYHDEAGLEWPFGREMPELTIGTLSGVAVVSVDGSGVTEEQTVTLPAVIWLDTTRRLEEGAVDIATFWPAFGLQLSRNGENQIGNMVAASQRRPVYLDDD